ncbi:MAG: hypothetical protein JW759_03035 [Candidatus Coatesbacteria bacterium]|nr:hypothetical protein [Candidatus Coatesbacteria bacterium]
MRLRYAFLAAAILIMSVFSALGLNGVWDPEASFHGRSGGHSVNLGGAQQLMPSDASTASMDWTDTDPSSWADLLMLHSETLHSPASHGFQVMDYRNCFTQVNYDGFAGDKHTSQAMAIQQFTRSLEGGGTQTELYVGVEAGSTNCSQVWRSGYPPTPGSWFQVARDYFAASETGNQHVDSAAVFNGKLYMGVCNNGGCQVWGTDGSEETGNSPYLNWTKVADQGFGNQNNCNAYCMTVFNGYLYVGTLNANTGCEVWRSNAPAIGNWTWVNYGGFGSATTNEPDNICVMDMTVFGGQLYAGTYNWPSNDETDWSAGRIFKSAPTEADSKHWGLVWDGIVNPGGSPTKYALAARCFSEFNNELYVGLFHNSGYDIFKSADGSTWQGVCTIDGTSQSDVIDLINFCDTNEDPPLQRLYATTGRAVNEQLILRLVWRSADSTSWETRSDNGFGDPKNNSLFCFGTFGKPHEFNALYVGTWNNSHDEGSGTGTEIWQTPMTETDCAYITLDSFDATAQKDGSILLHWVTGTEIGTAGFDLYRSLSPDFSSFEKVTPRMVAATGTPEAGAEYKVLDKSVKPGTLYYYFLVEIDDKGKMSPFGPIQCRARIPTPEKFEMCSAIIQMDTFGV